MSAGQGSPAGSGSPAAQASPAAPLELSGWGRHPVERCRVHRPESLEALQELVARGPDSLIARGLGRSYGDAALNPAGVVLGRRLDRMLAFDPARGVLHCEAGVSLAEILDVFLPRGFFFPVTPGTKHITVGGAIAADVHGKNHHASGSMGAFVEDLRLLVASGEIVSCSPQERPELFWATVGGMGLTGVIVEASLRLRPVTSAWMAVDVRRARNLDELLSFGSDDRDYEYGVAWIDCLAARGALGRSVLLRASHAEAGSLPPGRAATPLSAPAPLRPRVPFTFPDFALNAWSVRAFNELFYRAQRPGSRLASADAYFYPLDAVTGWNLIYGRRGMLQYQVVLPPETAREGLVELLEGLSGSGRASFLAVLKTFGPPSAGLLSFPGPGVTLALDLPYTGPDLVAMLRRLDAGVARRGGRVYLAKDACLLPEHFAQMYPGAARFREVKAKVDPEGRFASSQARRLGLVEAEPQRGPLAGARRSPVGAGAR